MPSRIGERAEEQWKRVKRYFQRFRDLSREGLIHNSNSETYVDDVYAFFVNCYHLKDWIQPDDTSPLRGSVGGFGRASSAFPICRDICLGVKHLVVDRPGSDLSEHRLGRRAVDFNASTGGFTMRVFVRLRTEEREAYEIAEQCMHEWSEFLGEDPESG